MTEKEAMDAGYAQGYEAAMSHTVKRIDELQKALNAAYGWVKSVKALDPSVHGLEDVTKLLAMVYREPLQ